MSSQYAVASYVCVKLSPLDGVAAGMAEECAVEMNQKPSVICKAHCDNSSQSSETVSVNLPPFIALTSMTPIYLDDSVYTSSMIVDNRPVRLTDGSPPLRIQYQVFRI